MLLFAELGGILLNFIIFVLSNPDFQNQLITSAGMLGTGLVEDLILPSFPYPKEADLSIADQVKARGYRFEEHKITTEDGYILTAFRIPGKLGDDSTGKPVAYMQHGLLDDGGTWFFNDAKFDISF